MVRELIHDEKILSQKSLKATKADKAVAEDLLDTLKAHKDGCVGMAANMIGELKCIIAFEAGGKYMIMYNPEIIGVSGEYETEEGCLSYMGGPVKVKRYRSIEVQYEDEKFKKCKKIFKDFTAQIIQHEVDHLGGVLV
jgi:peptide deformylase